MKKWRIRHRVNSIKNPTMEAGVKYFSVSGKPATLKKSYQLSATQGSYSLSGQNASLSVSGATNSQSGDEAALNSLSSSITGLDSSWNTPISLDGGSAPTGVTTSDIGGQYRVTQLNINGQMSGMGSLSGSLDIAEWGNLTECTLINTALNSFDTQYPSAIHDIGSKLEYLYITYSDGSISWSDTYMPHELDPAVLPRGDGPEGNKTTIHYGKTPGNEQSIIRGSVPADIDNLSGLKYYFLGWTDQWGGTGDREIDVINGIESISMNIWNITTLEAVYVYENWNIGASGNTFGLPATISSIPNFQIFVAGGGGGTDFNWWDVEGTGTAGSFPSDMDQLTKLREITIHESRNMTGFPDFQNSYDIEVVSLSFIDTEGTMPSWVWDGRFEWLDVFSIAWPRGAAMDGDFPTIESFNPNVTYDEFSRGYMALDYLDIHDHKFTGAIPAEFLGPDVPHVTKQSYAINNFTSFENHDIAEAWGVALLWVQDNDIEAQDIPRLDWGRMTIESVDPLPASSSFEDVVFHTGESQHYRWDGAAWNAISSVYGDTIAQQWNRINISQNRYVFADMLYVPDNAPNGETAIELYMKLTGQITECEFGNQKPAGTANTYNSTDGNGDIVINDFDSVYSHVDNSYQWQKDGNNISGATSKTYTITGATSSDNGVYTLDVSNSTYSSLASSYGVSDMTITSADITVSL